MKFLKIATCSVLLGALSLSSAVAQMAENSGLYGLWVVEGGEATVRVTDCGNGTPCGVFETVTPAPNSPGTSEQAQALVGKKVFWGFQAQGNGWANGQVFNPKDGQTYAAKLALAPTGQLVLQGCVGPFCQTQYWTRP